LPRLEKPYDESLTDPIRQQSVETFNLLLATFRFPILQIHAAFDGLLTISLTMIGKKCHMGVKSHSEKTEASTVCDEKEFLAL
jgi:hypothetical protein